MIKIRKNVFETNSSSVHTICISKNATTNNFPSHVEFSLNEYGWEENTVMDTASYLYTGICDYYLDEDEKIETICDHIKSILSNFNIDCTFEDYKNKEYFYIDHSEELIDFIDEVINDEKLLLEFLFGDSYVVTDNDNHEMNEVEEDNTNYIYFVKGN